MWQLLQALWGKIAGQTPPVPPAARTGKAPQTPPGKMPLQPLSHRSAEASQPTPEPSLPAAAWQGEEPAGGNASQEKSPASETVESRLGSAQPTSTAKSIGSFWALADPGSRISHLASASNSGRAVSSIATARLRQPDPSGFGEANT